MEKLNLKFASSGSLLNVTLNYVANVDQIELKSNDSLLIIGKKKELEHIKHEHLASKLAQLQIPKEWFDESLNFVSAKKTKDEESESKSGGNSASWLNKFIVHTISGKASRHNTPSRAHLVTKAVQKNAYSDNQLILVVCERQNGVANACAIARAFPLFSAKTSSTPIKERNVTVSFLFVDDNKVQHPTDDEINCFTVMSKSIRLSARIVETPCADMTTNHFLDEINQVAKELGLTPFVIEGEELLKQGFGGIYNVGKAAINPPKLVVLSSLKPTAKRTVAWVGKGIVFDTGGLCIKTRPGMCGMKTDCGGAAGILGAFYSAVKLGFNDNLHAVFCLAENAVAANALRPDDIIKLYSGKTIEITNTDAEGRLVLGDGVAYAEKDLKADIIVDMATLTGAQGGATGKTHAALLTNSDEWEKASVEAGKKSADLCFPIVFTPEFHFSQFNTEMADMTNSVPKADNASCSCAGLFIHSHLSSKYDGIWIHLDMASPAMDGERATGYGVAILNSLFGDSSNSATLRSISSSQSLPLKQVKSEDD